MLEELGGVYYVVCYKPRQPKTTKPDAEDTPYVSMSEEIGRSSEFCREGYKVVSETRIERADAESIFRLLPKQKLPRRLNRCIGLDGQTYELFWMDNGKRTAYEWWEHLPMEWSVIGEVADLLENHVRFSGYD